MTWFRHLLANRQYYDLIHAHAIHHHAYAGFLMGRLLHKPAIAKMALLGHDDPASIVSRRLGRLQQMMLRQATALVATSKSMAQSARQFGWPDRRLVHIPNGVDTEVFQPTSRDVRSKLRRKLGVPDGALVVVFVGIVARRKGLHTLVDSWVEVRKACPKALLLVVGPHRKAEHWGVDECYVATVKNLVKKNGLNASVRFVGRVSNPAIYLQAADLFAFPSQSEGMPNALLEAMACGIPFVAAQLGCIKEMAPDEQLHYLVPSNDKGALADALVTLAQDPYKRYELSSAVREIIERRYSLRAVADRYLELYRELVEAQ
jgi:glycosyltransferase involved in cell wall biosynthesis